jgi:hypothetical protein
MPKNGRMSRGTCKECLGEFAVRKDGFLIRHSKGVGIRTKELNGLCPGSEQSPVDEIIRDLAEPPVSKTKPGAFDLEDKLLPVLNEYGLVIGRAKVGPNAVVLVGMKWRTGVGR